MVKENLICIFCYICYSFFIVCLCMKASIQDILSIFSFISKICSLPNGKFLLFHLSAWKGAYHIRCDSPFFVRIYKMVIVL